ncbi:DUF4381 domain-containing protein [Dyella telluris]|uniref:DUF4381 domain-containing protein n=1 Tax=Dyella telluris TaxID=2763498 RepID=A0A7G8Q021_9GAMM|nr:DUF4381 domain-containing protein [Dyella telluris]QNK00129.1 DUF4381 domain-containing protein [Dyella telluris]
MYWLADKPPMASIADLKEIAAPAPVSYMPQTTGWWVLGGILLLGVLVVAFFKWRKWWRNRYRREAQAELVAIERAAADPSTREDALAAIPVLVKRTVLAWAPRQEVGPMSGDAWLRYLDGTYPAGGFLQGPGRQLDTLAYGQGKIGNDELAALMSLLHQWVDGHVAA